MEVMEEEKEEDDDENTADQEEDEDQGLVGLRRVRSRSSRRPAVNLLWG